MLFNSVGEIKKQSSITRLDIGVETFFGAHYTYDCFENEAHANVGSSACDVNKDQSDLLLLPRTSTATEAARSASST